MNLLDKIILEWSYRTKKGYPDINHKEDMYFDRDKNEWHYSTKEYDYAMKLLKERRAK